MSYEGVMLASATHPSYTLISIRPFSHTFVGILIRRQLV